MNEPLVYIVLVNWCGWRDTIQCLQSLQGLDYPNYRILVVDNDSTDDSVERLKEALPDIPMFKTSNNLGFAGGNNAGIRYAVSQGADFVWLLNNDTIVDSSALSAMVHAAVTDSTLGAVGSVLYDMHHRERIQTWGGGKIRPVMGISRHIPSPVADQEVDYITGASLLLRVKALEQVGLLDEQFFMYWEDADLGFRLRKAGWKLKVASRSEVWHKESASFVNASEVKDNYFNTSAVRFFLRHSRFPMVPITIGVGGRLMKRIIRGRWRNAVATLKGLKGYRNARVNPMQATRLNESMIDKQGEQTWNQFT